MKADELDDLILSHLEGADPARLDEALRGDPAAGLRFAELALQEGLLREIAETEELKAAARRPRPRRRTPERSPLPWTLGLAAAAGFLLLLLVLARTDPARPPRPTAVAPHPPEPDPDPVPEPPALRRVPVRLPDPQPEPEPPPPPPPPKPEPPREPKPPTPPAEPPARRETVTAVATVEKIEGDVVLLKGRGRVRVGQVLVEGEGIETGARDSFATLRLPDGTRLDLDPGALLARVTPGPARTIHVERGRVTARAVKQPAGESILLLSAEAEARVLGTRLSFDGARLDVTDGRVRLTRRADGAWVDVAAGQTATAAPGRLLAARPLPPLFQETFEYSPAGEWPRGWLKHETEPLARSGFRVLQDPSRGRLLGGVPGPGGLTQHAVIPLEDWPPSFTAAFRMRLSGTRSRRAGIEIGDGRLDPSIEVDAAASIVKVDWPRGKAFKQAAYAPAPGVWSEWAVSVDGGRFAVTVDRRAILEAELPGFGRVRGASLVSKGADPAQFDDVRILRQ